MDDADLKYGETYLDRMSPDDVLLFAKRAYRVLMAARPALEEMQRQYPEGSSWTDGIGGRALAAVSFVLGTLDLTEEQHQHMWATYFRVAAPSLFDGAAMENGEPLYPHWFVCESCKHFFQPRPETCLCCGGEQFRVLTLEDIEGHEEG